MATLIWLGLGSFLFSLILTPIIRDVFRVYDIVDRPDSGRKTHPYPIPRVGGIAIAASYLLASFFMPAMPSEPGLSLVTRLLPAIGIVFITGLIDDFVGLSPWQKLAAETVAALLAYWAGARVTDLARHPVPGWLGFVVTIVWLLACTNAFNLVDGLDGLAAGIGLVSTLTIFVGALVEGNMALCIATVPLAGCLLAFLCYNFNPATIFLGDGGSLLLGFLLGCYAVVWAQKSLTVLGVMAPLIAFSVPLLDVALSIIRRLIRRKPIFSADRGHIHHRLIDRGHSPRKVVLIIYGISAIAAAFALFQSFTRSYYLALLVAALFILVVRVGIGYLRYSEFALAGRFFHVKTFQQAVDAQVVVEKFAMALLAVDTPEACWAAIREYYPQLGFCAARFEVYGIAYQEGPSLSGTGCWTMRIPFGPRNFVEFARDFSPEDVYSVVSLANVLHGGLGSRFPEERGRAAGVTIK